MTIDNLIHISAVLLIGLIAGLLYGYDCSVIRGLGNLSDKEFLNAFQSINKAILNPYFFISFMGSLVVLPIAAWLSYKMAAHNSFYYLLAAALVYSIGVFGVTIFGNVPLNNLLDKFDISTASAEVIRAMRQKFETGWNTLHHIRTYSAMLSFLLAIISLIKK
ncbi:MAG: DUF1772 domain-containing protein [Ginsengibacter sp.]